MRAFKFLILGGLAYATVACDPPNDGPLVGENAPDFQVTSYESKAPTAFADLQKENGGKVVILDFWATWCGPCKALTPFVEDVYQKYKDKGVTAMAITNDNLDQVKKFEKNTPHQMPVYLDTSSVANLSYKVEGLPTVILIGKDGRVIYQMTGFGPEGPAPVGKELDAAIAKAIS